jgi:thiamine biosynthesis lipoprotein ApbE
MCESSILCDVYSTALFSMDIDSAKDFAKDKNIDILLFGNNEILYQSDNF